MTFDVNKKRLFIYILAMLCLTVAGYLEFLNIKLTFWLLPLSLGIVKDILDPILILLFVWYGWVFLVPAIMSYVIKLSELDIIILYISSAIIMGLIDTLISFPAITTIRLLKGVFYYLIVFGIYYVLCFIINHAINRSVKK